MKTAKEWLAHIKHASDTEVRHGSSVFLIESDIQAILDDGWARGMTDAARVVRHTDSIDRVEDRIFASDDILSARDDRVVDSKEVARKNLTGGKP